MILTFGPSGEKISSNKKKITLKFDNTAIAHVHKAVDAPTPFIDRLTVTLKVQNLSIGKAMKSAHALATEDKLIFPQVKPSKGYKRAHRIKLDSVTDASKWPFYEYAWDDGGITKIRMDFIPVDIGQSGLQDLDSVLTTLMPNGWTYFISHGRVTRIDIAVDYPEAEMSDFFPLPASCVTCTTRTSAGKLQTIELGKPKGSQTVIYDRKAKRISKGQSYVNKTGIRVERRIRLPNLMLGDLHNLKNPFTALHLVAKHVPKPQSEKNFGKWFRFVCTVEQVGLACALGSLPLARRTTYRKHWMEHRLAFWSPRQLHAAWLKQIKLSGIANEATWI